MWNRPKTSQISNKNVPDLISTMFLTEIENENLFTGDGLGINAIAMLIKKESCMTRENFTSMF
jgi:hypothetical protein